MNKLIAIGIVAAVVCGCASISPAARPDRTEGLCVHVGCGNGRSTVALSDSGRVLVQGLDADPAAVKAARAFVRSKGLYGPVCIDRLSGGRLPYAENLVNMVVAEGPTGRAVAAKEIFRVLRPGGFVMLRLSARDRAEPLKRELTAAGFADVGPARRAGAWLQGRKPWPAGMDQWTHPRHGPDGNAASTDQLVGPPRRVRWIAGPMQEASNVICAGGRFFHSGLIARDAFNGLPLWSRRITPAPLRLGFSARGAAGSVLPVAAGDRLYAFSEGKLQAIDGATGRTVGTFPVTEAIREILVSGGVLVATGAKSVQAFDAVRPKRMWSFSAIAPRGVIAGDGGVYLLTGSARRGGKRAVVKLDLRTGRELWRHEDYAWAPKARRLSYHKGLLVCEVSTLNNDRPGNSIYVLTAADGAVAWHRSYEPGMSHMLQARAIQAGGLLWVLNRGAWEGLDRQTGKRLRRHRAGGGHCYPPVGTARFLFAGEMSVTNQQTGQLDKNPITKGACGRDAGFVPANGLVYLAPKHCACWPMLQGYTALAPAGAGGAWGDPKPGDFPVVRGPVGGGVRATKDAPADWPCYRGGPWRAGSTPASVPAELRVVWTADLGGWPDAPLAGDWKHNLHVVGPVTPPVVAGGLVFVARPDAHELVALSAATGRPRWRFTANGRIDGPPTVHLGLCLFGTRSGWVYCLRASDGRLVWRLRAARNERRIVSFGQIESPWPVPGSVLVVDALAYFAAGRHPLADGGVLVFAVEPATGKIRWVSRINTLPMRNYYGGAGLEFDPFDLMVAEAPAPAAAPGAAPGAKKAGEDYLAMSRWRIDRKTGRPEVMWKSGFGYYRTGGGGVMAPRGVWTYGPRMSYNHLVPRPALAGGTRIIRRPLMVFRDGMLIGSMPEGGELFRRDFTRADAAKFNDEWYNQRRVPRRPDKPGDRSRSHRLARGAKWTVPVFDRPTGAGGARAGRARTSRAGAISAMVLAGERIFVVGRTGQLRILAAADGKVLGRGQLPPPVWDGLAAAQGSLYLSTADGKVLRLAARRR